MEVIIGHFSWKNHPSYPNLLLRVKNQEQSATCWAIVTSEVITYKLRIQHGEDHPFLRREEASTQELIDLYPHRRPELLNPYSAIPWVHENGLTIERNHLYCALPRGGRTGKTRQDIRMFPRIFVDAYTLMWGDPFHVGVQAIRRGPVTGRVLPCQSLLEWKFRGEEDIYAEPAPPLPEGRLPITHSVIVRGYGIGLWNGIPMAYYEVKNSWGSEWGFAGYGRIAHALVTLEASIDHTRYTRDGVDMIGQR